ncbi:2-O-methyltransferase NoeI [Mycolicibacterium vanbaalenii]|uniref:2-O-methyltransferase NoeI n=1 Tax=Mycolicibacterium vanbaalenii TaxID=110539 RepID=A0A5S9R2E3_MYCVN|nr:2-O-methyltransferase NoeI [Mycolicibacterium vanbaalenii]
MPSSSTVRKGLGLIRHPYFLNALVRHRVAAASEHTEAIRFCAANTLIDAGANKGQFSLAFRKLRPRARIIAFEPLPEAADNYDRLFRRDDEATLNRVALAAREGSAEFHVADRADSSSLLKPGQGQARAFGVRPARTMQVSARRLDDCLDLRGLAQPVLLKVDVQGGELGVFEGCASLELVDFIYVELSYVELYDGQPLFPEVCVYLQRRGFAVRGLYNQVSTTEFGPTQIDVLFKRVNPVGSTLDQP